MAFESVAGLASFDLVAGQRVPSVTPAIYDLVYKDRDRAFLNRISDGPPVEEVKWSWWERALRPQTVTVAEAIDIGETVWTMTAGHTARLVIGAILMNENPARASERVQVTDINGNDLTVTRGYGGTPDIAHNSGDTFRIIALPAQEMSSTGLDLLRHPSEFVGYAQIFRRDLKASRSSQGVRSYSGYQLNQTRLQEKLVEIRDELQQTALYGVPNSSVPLGSDTALRTTGGLYHYVTNVDNTAYLNQTSAQIKAMLDADAKELMEKGGDPNFVLASGDIFGAIMDLDADKVRYELSDGVRGVVISGIRTKFGPVLDLVYDRWNIDRRFCVGDYRKMQMRIFSNGGNPHIEELAKTKDGQEFMIIGELGFQLQNGADAFKVRTNVTVA